MAKEKTNPDEQETQQMPAVKPQDEQKSESPVQSFAKKVEDLMNHAYQQSQPAQGQESTEHHQKFAKWCNHLGDLYREVKQHV
jgi:hypothetical protein